MTTTDLIGLLKKYEFGKGTKRPREVSFLTEKGFIADPHIIVDCTGDGLISEICLELVGACVPLDNNDQAGRG